MTIDASVMRDQWMAIRATEKGAHALDIAERLGVAECSLLACVCGSTGPVSATRLHTDWPAFIEKLPKLGPVKTVTRNPDAVIEVEGTYGNIEFFGPMGQSVSSIDLRIFVRQWRYGFAVRDETGRGVSRSLQFFDKSGRAIHKLYLRGESDGAFFDELVQGSTSADQSTAQRTEPADAAAPALSDEAIDVPGLRGAWLAMKDTHELFGLLRRFGVTRTQALRLVGDDLAYPVALSALDTLLVRTAGTDLPLMIFVGNAGVIQIYTGAITRVARAGEWLNVLDPGFNLHVRDDGIASAWVVRKPTVDGHVTSLELYTTQGDQIALLVGKRRPGQKESGPWRSAVESLPQVQAPARSPLAQTDALKSTRDHFHERDHHMPASCRPVRRILAEGPVCKIEECSCGVYHVTLGALTLRLQAEVAASVWSTLGEAIHRAAYDRQDDSPHDAATSPHRRVAGEQPS